MLPESQGCFRLFRFAGITVLLHWSWLLVAAWMISDRAKEYSSIGWNIAEYVSLFVIVLLHEFGHALACRQVGGRADRIVLWPFGGIAFVSPPPRPGAHLWSIAAGPLVNVVLLPVTIGLVFLAAATAPAHAELQHFVQNVARINAMLLIFNMLPIYPLDGGQILHALLWFPLGRARSLLICSVLGLMGAAALVALAVSAGSTWLTILALFIAMQAWVGLSQVRTLSWYQPAIEQLLKAQEDIQAGEFDDALTRCERALEQMPPKHPARADAHALRGIVFLQMRQPAEAIREFDEALRLQPAPLHHVHRGLAHARLGAYERAVDDYRMALRLNPNEPDALDALAWLRATCPEPALRHGARAAELATRACELTQWQDPRYLATLAAACAESGDFDAAVKWQNKTLEDADDADDQGPNARARLQLYEHRLPYHEQPPRATVPPAGLDPTGGV